MIILIIVIILIICVYCHFLIDALNCRKQNPTHLDEAETDSECETKPAAIKSRTNKQGLPCLYNGVVSMKGLELSRAIGSKSLYDGTDEWRYGEHESDVIRVSLGAAYTMGMLTLCADKIPNEKNASRETRYLVFLSVAAFAIPPEKVKIVMDAHPDVRDAWLVGYAKSTQQKLR